MAHTILPSLKALSSWPALYSRPEIQAYNAKRSLQGPCIESRASWTHGPTRHGLVVSPVGKQGSVGGKLEPLRERRPTRFSEAARSSGKRGSEAVCRLSAASSVWLTTELPKKRETRAHRNLQD